MLRNLDRDCYIQEILNHHTEEEEQNTMPLVIAARNGNEDVVRVLLNVFYVDAEQTGTIVIDVE